MQSPPHKVSLSELARVFLKLGIIGFGGPAAHMALMREEVVTRKGWISAEEFQDMVGATNLIPGPNSTELAIHVGHKLLGKKGLMTAGICFILPAFLSVLSLAILYARYGTLPKVPTALEGVRPVIVAIVLLALFKFRETAVRNAPEWGIVFLSLGLVYFGVPEIVVILFAGVILIVGGRASIIPLSLAATGGLAAPRLNSVFFYFLKVGSVLFGSGYVLLAFLQRELVLERGWLTSAQLLDAVSVGQLTPGPVFTTATFIGYLLGEVSGAVAATLGIFLPSFFFVAVSSPFVPRLRASATYSKFLNGVNAASFSLMVYVTIELGRSSLISLPTLALFAVTFIVLKYTKINSAWLILAGACIGSFFLR